ncbi:UDP-3-O-acyl-N-acetylglucosamine deacetylase [bacterium]|jgi:UDP-3-O-[3-hydroxymyristoyl] N-acetylglucosamine deacetylase|nr:UDP-3-O-acyl-N-acetylglucosamine deacetylase [bacterium]
MIQRLNHSVPFEGIGIHSGKPVTLTIHPAEAGSGIVFERKDKDGYQIPLTIEFLHTANRSTIIRKGDVIIQTPEHFLSALFGLGIRDARLELDSDECPILNGAADSIVEKLVSNNLISEKETRDDIQPDSSDRPLPKSYVNNALIIDKSHYVTCGEKNEKSFLILPSEEFRVTYILEYNDSFVGNQIADIFITKDNYEKQICMCRTYGFEHEILFLIEKGLIKGASLDNAILVKETCYSTDLKFPNELARHKILDLLGDIAVIGEPMKGHIIARKTGHLENIVLAKYLANLKIS